MGIWNKSPMVDPARIAQLQAIVDADPMVRQFKAGYGSAGDPWRRVGGGRVEDPNQLSKYVRDLLKDNLPDGYDVSQDGQIVYTNKTPALKQAAFASIPIAAPFAAQGLAGLTGLGATAPTAAGSGVMSQAVPPAVSALGGVGGGTGIPAVIGGGASMARSIPWLDLAFSAIPSISGLIGTKMQVGAADRAAQIGADAYREGQRNIREMYETDRADFAPYREAGWSAMARMTGLLGAQAPPTLPASVQKRMGGPAGTYVPPAVNTGSPPVLSELVAAPGVSTTQPVPIVRAPMREPDVLMEAPTGERRMVPGHAVATLEARGARRVA